MTPQAIEIGTERRFKVPGAGQGRRWLFVLGWVAVALFFGGVVYRMFTRTINPDEQEVIHVAWKMNHGERIYVDFFQHHHPLTYHLFRPLVAWWGERASVLLAARVAMLPFIAGILWAAYVLARRLFSPDVAVLSALLLLANIHFVHRVMEPRADVPQVLFGFLAVLLFFPAGGRPARWHYALSGVCLGVAFLFLQKAVFTGAALGLVFLLRVLRGDARLSDLAAWIAGGVLTIAPFAAWLVVRGEFAEYYFLNWTLNAHFLYHINPLAAGAKLYLFLAPFMVFATAAVAYLSTARQRELAVIAICLGLAPVVTKAPNVQYWLPFFPFLAILAAFGLRKWLRMPALAFAAIVFFAFLLPGWAAAIAVEPRKTLVRDNAWDQLPYQLARIDYVASITGKDDCVDDGHCEINLFRKDMDYFWFSVTPGVNGLSSYQALRPYAYDLHKLISERRPKVINTNYLRGFPEDVVADSAVRYAINSRQLENFPDPWIREHYAVCPEFPELLVRRDQATDKSPVH